MDHVIAGRRRGRPRKGAGILGTVGNVIDSVLGLGHTVAGVRRRGRPRKHPVGGSSPHTIAGRKKRPVGRPRKSPAGGSRKPSMASLKRELMAIARKL